MAEMSKITATLALEQQVGAAEDVVTEALRVVRTHFGMEVAYLSEVTDEEWIVRACDAPGLGHLIKPGDRRPIGEVYCKLIADGVLPQLMPNAADFPAARALAITEQVPIRAHVSVPIKRRDGSYFGSFCCLSPTPNPNLNQRDLEVMRSFANLAQREIQSGLEARATRDALIARTEAAIAKQAFEMAFQPIVHLQTRQVAGFEALCRFRSTPYRSPDTWFRDAASVGLGTELEYTVLDTALPVLCALPAPLYLTVNAGPELIASGQLATLFAPYDCSRLVLEVTEHTMIEDYAALSRALADLRSLGVRIAVDDTGAGYSGLQQMIRLKPEVVKLDQDLVSGIDSDPVRRALCAALLHYASETGSTLVAEGIETESEAATLADLGVPLAQGFLFGRPMPLARAMERVARCGM